MRSTEWINKFNCFLSGVSWQNRNSFFSWRTSTDDFKNLFLRIFCLQYFIAISWLSEVIHVFYSILRHFKKLIFMKGHTFGILLLAFKSMKFLAWLVKKLEKGYFYILYLSTTGIRSFYWISSSIERFLIKTLPTFLVEDVSTFPKSCCTVLLAQWI